MFNLLAISLSLIPHVDWKIVSATNAKETLKPFTGKFPYWLESNCKYAVGTVFGKPIVFLPFDKIAKNGNIITLAYYVDEKTIQYHKVQFQMWKDFESKFSCQPQISVQFQSRYLKLLMSYYLFFVRFL